MPSEKLVHMKHLSKSAVISLKGVQLQSCNATEQALGVGAPQYETRKAAGQDFCEAASVGLSVRVSVSCWYVGMDWGWTAE